MHIQRMTVEQLTSVAETLIALIRETSPENPLAAALSDLLNLVLLEQLVHLCRGDRELAVRLHRERAARARGDS